MIRISNQWRIPFYLGILAWLSCIVLSGVFVEGAPQVVLSYLMVSLVFWVGAFAYGHSKSAPSYLDRGMIAVAPVVLFFGTLFIWWKIWT